VATLKRRDALARPEVDPLDANAARMAALDALARRDRASEDLRRKLLERGYDPGVAGVVIARLTSEKLVDDRRYVENFIGFHAARGQGPLRVRADLLKLGLPDELVKAGVAAYGDWAARLGEARQKKFGAALPTQPPDRQRQARFLGYRGFTGAQIRMALGLDSELGLDSD
jgi:regulatory protein